MLDRTDLSKKLDKATYKSLMPKLSEGLYQLQKATWDEGIPVIILFEGWDAAGKGTTIQRLTRPLDPRGFKLYPVQAARPFEKKRPWLWRFWRVLPPRGEWAIFDRSWYGRVMVERVEKLIPEREWRRAYRDIVEFERMLVDDGYLIVKFFLHISKDAQRRRFNKLSKNKNTAWHVTEDDWLHHRHYDVWLRAYEEAFERTDTEWCPWQIIGATNRRYTRVRVCQRVLEALSERLGLDHEVWTAEKQTPEEPYRRVVESEENAQTDLAVVTGTEESETELDHTTDLETEAV
jgi:polyphosphate kinase 2 (PPK2 family)